MDVAGKGSSRSIGAVFEELPEAAILAGVDRRIERFNPAAERLFGYSAEEVAGLEARFLCAVSGEFDRLGRQSPNARTDEGGDRARLRFRRKDGSAFTGEASMTVLRGSDGCYIIIRNVDRKVGMEKALADLYWVSADQSLGHAERIDKLLDLGLHHFCQDMAAVSRIEGDAWEARRVRGATCLDVGSRFDVGMTYCDHATSARSPVCFNKVGQSALAGHAAYAVQGFESYIGAPVFVDGDMFGTVCFAARDERVVPFDSADIEFLMMLAQWVGREISAKKAFDRLEEARASAAKTGVRLAEERERFRDFADLASDVLWETDSSGHLVYLGGAEWLPDRANSQGKRVTSVFCAPGSEAEARILGRVFSGEPFRDESGTVVGSDGKRRHFLVSGKPAMIEGRLGYRGAATDVTAAVVAERRRKRAERLQALGQLAGGVAHELNNILQPIRMYAEGVGMKFEREGSAEDLEDAQAIIRNVDVAAKIVDDILSYARTEGVAPDKRQARSLDEAVDESVQFISRFVPSGARFRRRGTATTVRTSADGADLSKILANLVKNAVAASRPTSPVSLVVSERKLHGTDASAKGLAPGLYGVLSVVDLGVGMDREARLALFDPFFTTKEPGKGTGLGLWIVWNSVRELGGWLDVRSRPGLGTRISVYLPHVPEASESC